MRRPSKPTKTGRPKKRRRYKLATLLAKFKPKHRHGEWKLGGAVGHEIW